MDYPGDLSFFLMNSVSNLKLIYTIAAIALLIILILTYLPWIKSENPSARTFVKILSSSSLFLFLVSVFIILMRMPGFLLDEQNIDESLWIAGTATFLQSLHLWTSFDTTTSGPIVMLPLILIKLTGLDLNYASARLAGVIFCIIPSVIFCFYTIRILLDEKNSRILILPLVACFSFMNMRNYIAYNGEYEIIFFSSLAILFHTKLMTGNKQSKYLILYGLIIGALPFTKLQATPIAISLGFCLFVFLLQRKTNLISYVYLFLGLVSPLAFILIWLLITGGLKDFWFSYITGNLNYGQPDLGINNSSWLYFKYFVYLLRTLPDSKFYYITLICVSGLTGIILVFRNKIRQTHFFLLLSSIALLLSAYFSIVKTSHFYEHYFLIFFIPVLYITVIIVHISYEAFPQSKEFKSALIISLIISFLLISIDGITRINNPTSLHNSCLIKNLTAQTINKYGKANDKMAIWGWNSALYVQTGLILGTRYGDCRCQLTKTVMQEYFLNTYLEDLKKNRPLIFADIIAPDAHEFTTSEFKHQNFPLINNYIQINYRKVETIGGKDIYIRRN
jgi:hypothetical protein